MKDIKVISQKPVLKSELFTVFDTYLKLPDGSEKKHQDVKRDDAISVLPICGTNEVFLIRQYRYLLGKRDLEVIAGMVNKGEDPDKTVRRELEEETGIKAGKIEKLGVINSAASISTWRQHLYIAKDLTFDGKIHWDDTENIELVKMSLPEAVNKVLSGEIDTASSINVILWVDKLLQQNKL